MKIFTIHENLLFPSQNKVLCERRVYKTKDFTFATLRSLTFDAAAPQSL